MPARTGAFLCGCVALALVSPRGSDPAASPAPDDHRKQVEKELSASWHTLRDHVRDKSYLPQEAVAATELWLTRGEREGVEWRFSAGLVGNYLIALREARIPEQQIQARLAPHLSRIRRACQNGAPDARARKDGCPPPVSARIAYSNLLFLLLKDRLATQQVRDDVPVLARQLARDAETDGLGDETHALVESAGDLLSAEYEWRLEQGQLPRARRLLDQNLETMAAGLRSQWARRRFPSCSGILSQWTVSLERVKVTAWRPPTAWQARRVLNGFIAEASARQDLRLKAEALRLLANWDYATKPFIEGSADAQFLDLETLLKTIQAFPAGHERDQQEFTASYSAAVITQQAGDSWSAVRHWRRAVELMPPDSTEEAWRRHVTALSDLGSNLMALGELREGHQRVEEARQLLESHGDPRVVRSRTVFFTGDDVYGSLGDFYAMQSESQLAAEKYRFAIQLDPSNRHGLFELPLAEILRTELRSRGQSEASAEVISLYKTAAREENDEDYMVRLPGLQAGAFLNDLEGNRARADDYWRRAEALARNRANDQDLAFIQLAWGHFLLRSGSVPADCLRARTLFDSAILLGVRTRSPHIRWQAYLGRGQAGERLDDLQGAVRDYQMGAQISARVRELSAISPDARARLLPETSDIYKRLVPLLVRLDQKEAAFTWLRRYKGQVLRRMLAGSGPGERPGVNQVLVADVIWQRRQDLGRIAVQKLDLPPGESRPEVDSAYAAARRALNEVESAARAQSEELPSDAGPPLVKLPELLALVRRQRITLVDYLVTNEKLLLFTLSDQGLEVRKSPAAPQQLIQWAKEFEVDCADSASIMGDNRLRRTLYDALIRPLAGNLPPERQLVVIPDGPLHNLPFAALAAGLPGHQFLVEDRPIASAPSADVFHQLCQAPVTTGSVTVLARSYEDRRQSVKHGVDVRARFDVLHSAIAEAHGVEHELYARTCLDSAADRNGLLAALLGSVVWYTGHVQYDQEDPSSTALVLAGANGQHDLFSVRDLLSKLPAPGPKRPAAGPELVVLSGCNSVRGQDGVGEGVTGLAWGFECRGTKSVVGCLWSIADSSTQQLMTEFAHNLTRMSRADALRQAQIAMIRRRGYFARPYYWAAPVLIGRTDAIGPLVPAASPPDNERLIASMVVLALASPVILLWARAGAKHKHRNTA